MQLSCVGTRTDAALAVKAGFWHGGFSGGGHGIGQGRDGEET